MDSLNKPAKYVIIFLGAGLLWFLGFVGGGALIQSIDLVTKADNAIVVWGIVWAACLVAASGFSANAVYEDED
jgi:hypothetical protein